MRGMNLICEEILFSFPFIESSLLIYCRDKIHGLEYPPGQRIIIKSINNTSKPENENIFPFECKFHSLLLFISIFISRTFEMAGKGGGGGGDGKGRLIVIILMFYLNCLAAPSSSSSSKEPFSSVALPPPAPLASPTSPCAQRCFIVCVPEVSFKRTFVISLLTTYIIKLMLDIIELFAGPTTKSTKQCV